jgi:lysozyme
VDRYRYPIAGIDVSKHNGDIDYQQVRDDDYQFVFIKASEGMTYKDDAFERNYQGARKAGLKVGAYHFFRKNRTGQEQAENLLAVVKGKELDLPLVIDLEDDWGNGATVNRKMAIERVMDMIEILTGKGYQVMIYTNLDGYNKYYKDMLGDHDLWLCSFTRPDLLTSLPHCIQQFSHEGKVKGAKGKVDLNVYRGSRSDWEQYLASVKKPNS